MGLAACLALARAWMQGARCGPGPGLKGKMALVTGANTGIGRETALELSKRGAGLVLLCRDLGRGEEAAQEIRRETGGEVRVQGLDLASLRSVRECAEQLCGSLDKVDILVNNAGIMACPEMRTEDGFEMQLGTNHLGHFLLTSLLLPLLEAAAPGARVVNVSSRAHERGSMQWQDLNWQQTTYSPLAAYSQAKLANVLFSLELSNRLADSGVNVYSLHPGVIDTDLFRHSGQALGPVASGLVTLARPFLRTAASGAQTSVYCAVSEEVAAQSGRYYSDCRERRPTAAGRSREDARRLWLLSERMTGLGPGIQEE